VTTLTSSSAPQPSWLTFRFAVHGVRGAARHLQSRYVRQVCLMDGGMVSQQNSSLTYVSVSITMEIDDERLRKRLKAMAQ